MWANALTPLCKRRPRPRPGRLRWLDQAASSSSGAFDAPSISKDFGVGRTRELRKEDISSNGQHDRELRVARNQALFRAVNEKIREMNDGVAVLTGTFAVTCECGDLACLELLELPVEAYERARESPYTFVVLADHVDPDVERVVATDDTHVIVEMPGTAARRVLDDTAPVTLQHREGD